MADKFESLNYDETATCERDGFALRAKIVPDDNMGEPWKEHDGHGPVSDWVTRTKEPGELVLNKDRGSFRYYDFAEACRIARRDGWGVTGGKRKGETAKQYATRAAQHDFDVLQAWCDDQWRWVGVVVTASREGVTLGRASLWGIESSDYPGSDGNYLLETTNELIDEALSEARETVAKIAA